MRPEPAENTLSFIGGGNMAEAMFGALIRSGQMASHQIVVADPSPARRETLAERWQIATTESNLVAFERADILVLAVKPQVMPAVLRQMAAAPEYAAFAGRKCILSVAAGIPLSVYETLLCPPLGDTASERLALIRVMPNTPSLVLEGMAGISAGFGATPADLDLAESLVSTMGKTEIVDEPLLDAVTALSGSGPAYFFHFVENLMAAGTRLGLSETTARRLALQTAKGAVRLLEESGEDAATLRRKVTSPGGTTQAALDVLMEGGMASLIDTALTAARDRSRELSEAATEAVQPDGAPPCP